MNTSTDMGVAHAYPSTTITSPRPRASKPPVSAALQEALDKAEESLEYHDRRMGKRVRSLRGEPVFDDEPATGVRCILPDPFPSPRKS